MKKMTACCYSSSCCVCALRYPVIPGMRACLLLFPLLFPLLVPFRRYRRSHQQVLGAGRFPVVMAWDCSSQGVDDSVDDENRSSSALAHGARRRARAAALLAASSADRRLEDDEDEDWSD